MKGAVIALICAAALAHAELNENGCPINPYIDILKPHPNCNKYYQCTQGELLERKCASDLVFDEETQSCDWPDNVDCKNRIPPTPNSSEEENQPEIEDGGNSDPSEAPKICAVEGSDSVLVAHENCNQFYVCDAGVPVARDCWGNLLFNPANNQCDWPENVNCGDRIVGGGNDGGDSGSADGGNGDGDSDNGGNNDPSEAPKICAVEGSDGVLVAHENCRQFYKCNGGIPVTLDCWGNLLFNPTNNQCDWPENVDCGNRIIGGENSREDGGNGDSGNGDGGNGDGGNGDGGNGDSGNGGNSDPNEAPKICAAEGSDGVLVAHQNCNQFFKCNGGKPVALDCWGNLLFNPTNNQCDWPENVDCGNRINEGGIGGGDGGNGDGGNGDGGNGDGGNGDGGNGDGGNGDSGNGGNSDPSEANKICAAEGSDGVLVAHENCNQFFKCNGGKPVALDCWGNLLFNPTNNQCDWPENVDCGNRINEGGIGGGDGGNGDGGNGDGGNGDSGNGGNSDPSEAPKICAAEGSDGVLVAHENCNQFFKCNGGKPVALDCWGNLLFNPTNNQCDWPENVDCGNRINDGGIGGGDGGNGDGGNGDGGNGDGGNGDSGNGDSGNGGTSDPSDAPKICAAEGSDGVLVAHENCNQFFKCNGGKPVALDCWGNLLFNPTNNQCDWPENVDCGNRINEGGIGGGDGGNGDGGNGDGGNGDGGNGDSGNGGTSDPSEAPKICAAEGSDGVLVAHENCNQFFKCNGGKPVALDCWGNLLFNPTNNQCDWPENVDCGNRINEGGIGGGDGGNGDGGNGDGGNGDGGNGDGGNGDSGNSGNSDPSEAPKICAAEGSDGVLVAHENCNQFFKCNGGKPVALDCWGNLLFNPTNNQCDWPENVDCGNRINEGGIGGGDGGNGDGGNGDGGNGDGGNGDSSNGGNSDPSEAPKICDAEGSDGVLVAHENCNQFYNCFAGKPVALNCWGNLLFNPANNQCDWPDNVNCGDRIIGGENSREDGGNGNGGNEDGDDENSVNEGNSDPSQAPQICAIDGSDGILVAHENCNQFYVCDAGAPVAHVCWGNLLFNPANNQCDWPENVNCGDRIVGGGNDGGDSGSADGGNGDGDSDNGGNSDPSEAHKICAVDGSDGVLVAHENCRQFYKCNEGIPVTLDCWGNLLFNPTNNQCDWPENVDCGNRIIGGENSRKDGGNGDGYNGDGGKGDSDYGNH